VDRSRRRRGRRDRRGRRRRGRRRWRGMGYGLITPLT